jgi:2-iminoacetate synthase ThiH
MATQNGDTVEGRQKTSDTAKLAIIAVVKTAESMHRAGREPVERDTLYEVLRRF